MSKESTRALTGMRTLTKQAESANMTWSPMGGGNKKFLNPGNLNNSQWQGIQNKAMFYHESYFDLSGYELDDLTLLPIECRIQDPGLYNYNGTDDIMIVYDIYTQERMSQNDMRLIKENHIALARYSAPGMPEGPQDREQIVFGMCRVFARNGNITGLPCLLYTSPSPRDKRQSRMPSSA